MFQGHVTDISGRQNKILGVEIPTTLTRDTLLTLIDGHDSKRPPQTLRPNESAEIQVMFFVQPVVSEPGKPWRTSLVFIDQYNNRHEVKNCIFREEPSAAQ
jgi:hypothetical protein